jgi:lipopolysaccharide cholinephosphotransferase
MDLKKVRDRTPEELLARKNEFLKICDILEELNINYYLVGGILLGAIRDQDLIKWDWGVDISVFSKELLDQIDPLTESLKKAGFEILKINKKEDCKIYFKGKYCKKVTGYSILGWSYSKIKDVYWRSEYSVPSKFLNNLSTLVFFGRKFKCPYNPEDYLTYAYGDWKVPLRSSDKKVYNSNNYYKITFIKYLKNIIKKYILRN